MAKSDLQGGKRLFFLVTKVYHFGIFGKFFRGVHPCLPVTGPLSSGYGPGYCGGACTCSIEIRIAITMDYYPETVSEWYHILASIDAHSLCVSHIACIFSMQLSRQKVLFHIFGFTIRPLSKMHLSSVLTGSTS